MSDADVDLTWRYLDKQIGNCTSAIMRYYYTNMYLLKKKIIEVFLSTISQKVHKDELTISLASGDQYM